LPPGPLRDRALEHIHPLDCSNPCTPSSALPPEAVTWAQMLVKSSVDEDAYAAALAKTLKELVCSDSNSTLYILRGVSLSTPYQESRLESTKGAASGLIDDLINKDSKECPVAAAMTDADRRSLLRIKK